MAEMSRQSPTGIEEASWAEALAKLEEARRDRDEAQAALAQTHTFQEVPEVGRWELLVPPLLALVGFVVLSLLTWEGETAQMAASLVAGLGAALLVALCSAWARHLASLPSAPGHCSAWSEVLPSGLAGTLGAILALGATVPAPPSLRSLAAAIAGGALVGGLAAVSGQGWKTVAHRRDLLDSARRDRARLQQRSDDLGSEIDRLACQVAAFEGRSLHPTGWASASQPTSALPSMSDHDLTPTPRG